MDKKNYSIITLAFMLFSISVSATVIDSLKNLKIPDINNINALKAHFSDMNGDGIIIGQKENTPDFENIDLRSKIILSNLSSKEQTPHATKIAALMVGNGITSPMALGIAPESKLIPISFFDLGPESKSFYLDNKITIVNHSYGTAIGNYDKTAFAYDSISFALPNLINIFSSGNSGQTFNSNGKYAHIDGFANITGSYKLAKNVITVGAVDEHLKILPSSSKGPANDGRIKPELVAYSEEGTSASSATVSGAVALLQQIYKQENSEEMPSSLLKAVLLNTADDLGKPGPNYESGFGNLNAYKAGQTIHKKKYFSYLVKRGESYTYNLEVPAMAKNLKITLIWTDPPAQVNLTKTLVNDLDLKLTDGIKSFYPWVLSVQSNLDSLKKPATPGIDTLNNVEQITLAGNLKNHYMITVDAKKIRTKDQLFFVAYDFEVSDKFEWLNPLPNQYIRNNSESVIKWTSTLAAKTAKLEVSTDGGKNWSLINENVDLDAGILNVKFPKLFLQAKLRMQLLDTTFESGTFILTPPLLTPVPLYVCTDSSKLNWTITNPQESEKYIVYKLNKPELRWDTIAVTSQNSISLKHLDKSDIFSVGRLNPAGIPAEIGNALQLEFSEVACFFRYFNASKQGNTIQLALELSTDGPDSVIFMKTMAGKFIPLNKMQTNDKLYYTIADTNLQRGFNNYYAKLIFKDGFVKTPIETVTVFKNSEFFVSPVPAVVGSQINFVGHKFDDYNFKLYDTSGKELINKDFSDANFSISSVGLKSSIYIFIIKNSSGSIFEKGKIIVK